MTSRTRPAVCLEAASTAAGFTGGCVAHACSGHRRDDRYLQRRQCRRAAAAAVPQSDRLIILFENNLQRGWTTFSVAPANFVDWARQSRTFESMVALDESTAAIMADGQAEQVPATIATAGFFTVFRAAPIRGRTFVAADDAPGAAAIAVVAYGLWQRRFGGDESIVGRVVTVNERPTTIVGVMPQGFGRGSPDTDLWLPYTLNRAQAERGGRTLTVDRPSRRWRERRSGAQRDGRHRRPAGVRLSWHQRRMGRHSRPARGSGRRYQA